MFSKVRVAQRPGTITIGQTGMASTRLQCAVVELRAACGVLVSPPLTFVRWHQDFCAATPSYIPTPTFNTVSTTLPRTLFDHAGDGSATSLLDSYILGFAFLLRLLLRSVV